MALITNGLRKPSLRLAVEIEKATDGAVTRQELRPDVFA
jgi:DNA-binding transcriptional regulator YdaS (Cro superfamily)